jgi:hypothetical protein
MITYMHAYIDIREESMLVKKESGHDQGFIHKRMHMSGFDAYIHAHIRTHAG